MHIVLRYCRNENTAVWAALWGSENKAKWKLGCPFVFVEHINIELSKII